MTLSDGIIIACSIIGLLISLYFTLAHYHILKPDAAFIPAICRMDQGICRRILQAREARILVLPNFALGLLYYCAIILYVFVQPKGLAHVTTAAALATVVLGVYLTYTLLATLKLNCVLCYASHVNNAILFIALIAKHSE